jgi:serine/threonine protein kinase
MYTYIQSRYYRAPEVILGLPYDCQIDMWSLGCILMEMLTGHPLFNGKNEGDQLRKQMYLVGIPPSDMLHMSPKAHQYFYFDRMSDTWHIIADLSMEAPTSLDTILGNGDGSLKVKLFKELIRRMLDPDPRTRIRPTDALHHPFFAKPKQMEVESTLGRDSESTCTFDDSKAEGSSIAAAAGTIVPSFETVYVNRDPGTDDTDSYTKVPMNDEVDLDARYCDICCVGAQDCANAPSDCNGGAVTEEKSNSNNFVNNSERSISPSTVLSSLRLFSQPIPLSLSLSLSLPHTPLSNSLEGSSYSTASSSSASSSVSSKKN